jgi:hypothetical protein
LPQAQARCLGHTVRADPRSTVDPALSVAESHGSVARVHPTLAEHVTTDGGATMHVCSHCAA